MKMTISINGTIYKTKGSHNGIPLTVLFDNGDGTIKCSMHFCYPPVLNICDIETENTLLKLKSA